MNRFHGDPAVFWMAICEQCGHALPFPTAGERDDWQREHEKTGHQVSRAVDVRPDHEGLLKRVLDESAITMTASLWMPGDDDASPGNAVVVEVAGLPRMYGIVEGVPANGIMLPDPDAEPGEWSPFDDDGNLDADEGWVKMGAIPDGEIIGIDVDTYEDLGGNDV